LPSVRRANALRSATFSDIETRIDSNSGRAGAAACAASRRWPRCLHRRLATHLSRSSLIGWRPTSERNLDQLRGSVNGEPHLRNLGRWQLLVGRGDVLKLQRILTGWDRDSIEMRSLTMGGLLSPEERSEVLRMAG
jgi:hypothetical protein